MSIAAPTRKGLRAKAIAKDNPDLSLAEVASRAAIDRGAAKKAVAQERFGRDKPKGRA